MAESFFPEGCERGRVDRLKWVREQALLSPEIQEERFIADAKTGKFSLSALCLFYEYCPDEIKLQCEEKFSSLRN
jgi:hypothetical protein